MDPEGASSPFSHRTYVMVLTVLFLLFCGRVFAQLIQAVFPVTWLPPFEAWASGALPYWLLVISQVLIIMVCARVIWRMHSGRTIPSATAGKVLLILGSVYFGLMGVRLIIGLTVATDHFWFSARLPTAFHFVLASFVFVCGWFHHAASGVVNLQRLGKSI